MMTQVTSKIPRWMMIKVTDICHYDCWWLMNWHELTKLLHTSNDSIDSAEAVSGCRPIATRRLLGSAVSMRQPRSPQGRRAMVQGDGEMVNECSNGDINWIFELDAYGCIWMHIKMHWISVGIQCYTICYTIKFVPWGSVVASGLPAARLKLDRLSIGACCLHTFSYHSWCWGYHLSCYIGIHQEII